jgi:hypothetical protein
LKRSVNVKDDVIWWRAVFGQSPRDFADVQIRRVKDEHCPA